MTNVMATSREKISRSLGAVKDFNKTEKGIEAVLENAWLTVNVFDEGIININICRHKEPDTNPFSVIMNPEKVPFDTDATPGVITLTTGLVCMEMTTSPVRFTFKTKAGKVINEDDEQFGTSFIEGQVTTYKKLQEGERFIGLGEKTGPLDRRGRGYQHWNTDCFGYGSESDPLYCSTPFYIGVHNGLSYGIFLDNSYKSFFNFGASNDRFSSISADGGDMNYYFIYGETVADILNSYSKLTGYMPLPPLWSIGYQQCRYSYYPDTEVKRIAKTFRDKNIPADVIVLDIHYMEKYKIFTWDGKKFPDPKALIDYLEGLGFHVVVMCDPGIKIEKGYATYDSGVAEDVFAKYPDGSYYSGSVWPGLCHFPDFTMKKTRDWWQKALKAYTDLGIDGYWNDMNEIATWGQMLPELIEFDFEGDKASTRKGRNVYGMQMSRATFEGTKALLGGKRPFNLTRAGFSGVQRYAAVWTGDNIASDEHMMVGVRLVNSMGLAGIAFAGYDVGGFIGSANEPLFARWMQIGAFSPFYRGHSMINSRASEPWCYGEEVEEVSNNYITLRYKLMAYLYSCFYESSVSGMPVARSLAIDYTHDHKIYDGQFQNQYLFGPSLLVAPVESYKNLVKVYLPQGGWYELFTDQYYEGNEELVAECSIERLPVFVKASAIVPVCPGAHTNTRNLGDTLELHIYYGQEAGTFVYYEDDGETYAYEQSEFYRRKITFDPASSSITVSPAHGNFKSRISKLVLCLHGFDDRYEYTANGRPMSLETGQYRFILPISNFDPFSGDADEALENMGGLKIDRLKSAALPNDSEEIEISWK